MSIFINLVGRVLNIEGLLHLGANFFFSTAVQNVIRDYVHQFLICLGITYGDSTFTQFDDEFLTEHVKTVTVTDTELVARDKKVKLTSYH
jgi:translation initiation factor 2 beta subunit (eIF-2beta)/eIF-5